MNMKPIITPIAIEKLEAELKKIRFVRHTNYGKNEIYDFSAQEAPNLMQEVGRLRELAFRSAGGGTGKEADIDRFDTAEIPYRQLIVWNPKTKRMLGGYRYIICKNAPKAPNGKYQLATTNLFKFSEKFEKEYLPYLIELGRSFVHPDYQSSTQRRKGIFTLDNLWDGLAALTVDNPDIKHLFGKVTMYQTFNHKARDLILFFLHKYFPDKENLIEPYNPLQYYHTEQELDAVFTGEDFKTDSKILARKVRNLGENVPPLINSYMNLSSSMKVFGTALNTHFGDVEETGIMITIADIYKSKSKRHITSYLKTRKNH